MKPRSSKPRSQLGSLITLLVLLVGGFLAVLNAQFIIDSVRYYQYSPSNEIAAFATDSGMNDKGKYLFYASQPSLEERQGFNEYCEHSEKNTAILGCYDGQNIYIFNVTDPRLDGIRATTAAHEMLHAAYMRLSENDRQSVDSLLDAEYKALSANKELAERMEFYKRTTPSEIHNELHSIVGTEIAQISGELEQYYSKYFTDRSKVVSLHGKYSSVFRDLRSRADTIRQQMEALQQRITNQTEQYNTEADNLQRAINAFNSRAQEGDFTTQSEFTTERQQLIAQTNNLDTLRVRINSDINEYNTLVSELNDIALETDELNRSLDSTLAPAPSV